MSLISITVLLLNDHVFKIISPSWLTGKLSDFAGLFFFPFIVGVGLSLILDQSNISSRQVGVIAFASAGILFSLLKTSPVINEFSTILISALTGRKVQIVLDWTDIFGLIMLWPAWKLWNQPIQGKLSRKPYISLAVGLFACLATSPALPPFDTVTALAYRDGIVYAEDRDSYYVAQSTDTGDNWERIHPSNEEWNSLESLLHEHELPIQACDPELPQICYRIEGDDKVLISNNSGEFWETAWEVPPERHDFVLRISGNITTHDLIIVQHHDSRYLFIAMGNNGILRKQLPAGEWERIGIEEAQPARFSAPDVTMAISIIGKEILIWIGIAYVVLLFSTIAIWQRLPVRKGPIELADWLSITALLTLAFVLAEAVIGFVGFLLLTAAGFMISFLSFSLLDALFKLAVAIAIIAPFIWLLRRIYRWTIAFGETASTKIIIYCVFTVLGVLLIGALPWPLWALGIIPRYTSAQTISIVVTLLITVLGYYLIYKTNGEKIS